MPSVIRLLVTVIPAVLLSPSPVGAQQSAAFPSKSIRMIVPFAAGGNADILGRILAQKYSEAFGQQVIVDNRAGANGVIGSELAAKSPPDGYTLLFVASGHAINPGMYAKLPFDPINDFAPVGLMSSTPLVLAITNALPAKSVKDLVALARAKPGQMSYASQGNGSPGHLAGALLNTTTGINVQHIPYKATAQALTDLISGEVQVMYPSLTSVLQHVRSGKLRALAITSRARSLLAPELPTVIESGVRDYEAGIWNGVLAPAHTPPAVISRLNSTLVKIVQSPDVRDRILATGADPMPSTPEEFGAFIAAEIRKWTAIIKSSGAKMD